LLDQVGAPATVSPVRVRVPEERVSPFEPVRSPADVIVPVPVVAMLPVVEMPMLAAKSLPEMAA